MDDTYDAFVTLIKDIVANGDASKLGRELGVNTSTVLRWARGESRPSRGVVFPIMEFASALQQGDAVVKADFVRAMAWVVEHGHAGVLARAFGVNPSTVARWATDKNLPHPAVWPILCKWVKTVGEARG